MNQTTLNQSSQSNCTLIMYFCVIFSIWKTIKIRR